MFSHAAVGYILATIVCRLSIRGCGKISFVERKAKEGLLSRLDDPEAATRRDESVLAALATVDLARAHEGLVHAAGQDHSIAETKDKSAKSELDALLAATEALAVAETVALSCKNMAVEAEGVVSDLKSRLDAAKVAESDARIRLAQARSALDAARHQTDARKASVVVAQLADRIAKALEAQASRDAAAARIKASVATPEWLSSAERADGDVALAEAALRAQTTTLRLDYSGDARVELNGRSLPAAQGVQLDGETRLHLPGIGLMTIVAQPLPKTATDALSNARASRDACLAEVGVLAIHDARLQASDRAEAVRRAELAIAMLTTLVPEGMAALQAAKAEAELVASDVNDSTLPSLVDLQAAVVAAASVEEQITIERRSLEDDHSAAREAAARALAAADGAAHSLDRAAVNAGPADTRDTRRAGLLRALAHSGLALSDAKAKLADLIASAPDLATAEAELRRANDAANSVVRQRAQVAERLAELSTEIRILAGNSIEERRDEIQGQLESARVTEARFARKESALLRLQTALEAERSAAQETYFGPVQQELKPLLSILHRDAALTFDSDSLLPSGLTRGHAQETLDDLSGGTREQIAILTRLAFARLFARQGRHMPIVLDDALVYSDDDRIIKMFTALTRVAQDQQIIVFSCRQLAFQDLGGERPRVEITDV